jgi:hypothetical protein
MFASSSEWWPCFCGRARHATDDGGKHVVEVMRHRRGQKSQRVQPVRNIQVSFEAAPLLFLGGMSNNAARSATSSTAASITRKTCAPRCSFLHGPMAAECSPWAA